MHPEWNEVHCVSDFYPTQVVVVLSFHPEEKTVNPEKDMSRGRIVFGSVLAVVLTSYAISIVYTTGKATKRSSLSFDSRRQIGVAIRGGNDQETPKNATGTSWRNETVTSSSQRHSEGVQTVTSFQTPKHAWTPKNERISVTEVTRDTDWDVEQKHRRTVLRAACAKHPELKISLDTLVNRRERLWPLIYDDKYKVIYCTICKVASTTLKSAFIVLMGKYPAIDEVDLSQWYTLDRSLHTLNTLPSQEVKRRLETYKKFIFVREPFSRELSGYRNKLLRKNPWYPKTVGTRIIRQFRPNASKEALTTGQGVTFTEFAKYLTRTRNKDALDIHWRPMNRMVLPCAFEYDYIGHLETAQSDIQNIFNRTGMSRAVPLPEMPTTNLSNSGDIFNKFYGELEASLVRDMYNTFKLDSELFGYKTPKLILNKLGEG